MPWHSTRSREELVIILSGRVRLEICASQRRSRRTELRAGQCAWLPAHTRHCVVNASRRAAHYLYVTAPAR